MRYDWRKLKSAIDVGSGLFVDFSYRIGRLGTNLSLHQLDSYDEGG